MNAVKSSKKSASRPAQNPKARGVNPRTRLIHGPSKSAKWDYSHHVIPPLTSSATFRLSSSQRGAKGFFEFACDRIDTNRHVPIYIYDRLDEPTRGMLEENLAFAEGGDKAVCFATGMAAITAAIGTVTRTGDEIVAHDTLYGCTYSYLTNWAPRIGLHSTFVNMREPERIAAAITARTRVVYFETPVNPTMELIDIAAVRKVVDRFNRRRRAEEQIYIIVDNTFSTPFCQRPLEHGAHIVCHSLTKGIGGFGTDMGGVVIVPDALHNMLLFYRKDFGGVLSPKAAWNVLVYGLPSLATRMINMQNTAGHVAAFLEKHPKIARVEYPGLKSFAQRKLAERQMRDYNGKFAPGAMIYFTLKDRSGKNLAAEKFINWTADHAYCITLAVSLGQVKTLIENPYSMTHSSYMTAEENSSLEHEKKHGIEPGGIRLSVGLEDRNDIIADLEAGLKIA
jgi:methionine-gamma-lyase